MHDVPGSHDHYDEDDRFPEDEEDHPLAKLDKIDLTSVGIDIGTATSQIIFSKLVLRRMGRELSSRFVVTERHTLYLSPVYFTPYAANRERIDDVALGKLVDAAYDEAGLTSDQVDTGAIILTGEAIRRDNARAIADLFAAQRGNFVCASAGHNFEALLAAHGSGSVAASEERDGRILNIDIGGGTTKLAVLEKGRIVETAAFHVGGRLIAKNAEREVIVLEPGGDLLAKAAGVELKLGEKVTDAQLDQVAEHMARAVISVVNGEKLDPATEKLFLTAQLTGPKSYDGVIFSGGVGEYVYGKEAQSFGDLGAPLGKALKRLTFEAALPGPLLPARECIRATVMGASQYTVQVSGNTIYHSDDELLPRKNLQVLRPPVELGDVIDSGAVAKAIQTHFKTFDLPEGDSEVALVFKWDGPPAAIRIAAFCKGLIAGLPGSMKSGRDIFLVFDHDLAGLVGAILKEEFEIANQVLSIDGVTLHDFDFIDLGRVLEPSGTVPVTIKSLVFQM